MLKIKTLFSGSSGNCYTINNGTNTIMVEAGKTLTKIREGLNFNLAGIDGCIVTHSHKDHCASVPNLIKFGVKCYMLDSVRESFKLKKSLVNIIKPLNQFSIGSFVIMPFHVQHDVPNVGFLIQDKISLDKLLFVTDTYYCKYKFKNLSYIMIECNYADDILEYNIEHGITPSFMGHRLQFSHFNLSNVKKFLLANDLTSCKEIHLIHLSGDNSNPELFQNEIEALTGIPTYIPA